MGNGMWLKWQQCLHRVPVRHQRTLSATAMTLIWSLATHSVFTQPLGLFSIIQVENISLQEGRWQWPHNGTWTKSELLVPLPQNLSRHLSPRLLFDPSQYLLIYFFLCVFYPIRVTAFEGHSRSQWWWVIMTVGTWVLRLLHHGVVLFFPLSSIITRVISELSKAANESLSTTWDSFVFKLKSTSLVHFHILCWISLKFWL